jgi:two-component system, cell cycle sensor histidine kinase and response regulator CckA
MDKKEHWLSGEGETVGLAEALIQGALDGLIAVDHQGMIVFSNAAAGRIYGYGPQEMTGQNLERFFPSQMFVEHQTYVRDFFMGRGRGVVDVLPVETEIVHRSGKAIPVEIALSSVSLGADQLVLACIRDISRRRETDERNRTLLEQLMQAQKMEAIGTLSAGVAHDFNNMLGAIMGYAAAILNEMDKKDRHYTDLMQVQSIVRRAKRLTENLLTFSRRAEFNSESIAVGQVVRQVTDLLRRTLPKSYLIKTRLTKNLFTEGDHAQLEQSLMNICLNARDAMPDGGMLLISSSRVMLDETLAKPLGLAAGPYCQLSIKDDGVGMDNATLERAFDPFFSTKHDGEGSGLGLALVFAVVQNHHGQVRIESQLGRGTEVKIYLPEIECQLMAPAITPRKSKPLMGLGEMIMLVDDEKHLRGMGKRLLEGLGYQVMLAENGQEAVALYQQQQQAIRLVILDVMMAGMSGLQTLEQLKAINPGVKILVSSGYNRSGAPKELLERGVCGFVQKPYGIDEINQAIRQALNQPQSSLE